MFPQQFRALNSLVLSKEVHRLKYIKQCGLLYLLYPNASHTKYQSAVGLANLIINSPNLASSEKELEHLAISGLLYNIGTGPFSHIYKLINKNFNQEEKTLNLIDNLKSNFDKKYVKDLILGYDTEIFNNRRSIDLVNIDYITRDSRMLERKCVDDSFVKNIEIKKGKLFFDKEDQFKIMNFLDAKDYLFKNFYCSGENKRLEYSFIEYIQKKNIQLFENDTDHKLNLTTFFNEYKPKNFNSYILLKDDNHDIKFKNGEGLIIQGHTSQIFF